MKKKIFCFFILLLFISSTSTILSAQEVILEGISSQQFHGVKSIDGKGYYTFFRKEKGLTFKSYFHLKIYDLDLNEISDSEIDLSKKGTLKTGTYNGQHFLFSFIDPKTRKVTYLSLGPNGEPNGKPLKEKIKRNLLKQRKFHPGIYSSGGSGFYIIDNLKGRTIGYRVRKVDNFLNVIWEEKYIPEKGQAHILHVESSEKSLLIVCQYVEKSSLKEPVKEMILLDGETGKSRFTYALKQGDIKLLPSAFYLEDGISPICAGMYVPANKEEENENQDGLFFMKMDHTGKEVSFQKIPWEGDIKKSIEEHTFGTAWWSTNPKIIFHEIKRLEDKYQFIGETFRRATSGTAFVSHMVESTGPGASLAVLDFIVFDIDLELKKILKSHFIPKEKMTVWVPTIDDYSLPVDSYFKKYDLLSYRFTEKWKDELNALVFYNWGRGKPYIGYAPLTDAVRINPKKIYLSKEAVKEGATNVIKSKQDKVLIYEHNKKSKTLKMWIETLN